MNKNIDCAAVKDLLPNYTDKLTSEETNEILEHHFLYCQDCTKDRDEMMRTLELDKVPENMDLSKFLNKTKNMYLLKGIMLSVGILAMIISFIVDIAVNGKLTWSIIVDESIIFVYAVTITAIISKKNKIVNAMAVFTVLIFPLFYIMEYVINANYLSSPVQWVNTYGLPITAIWLVIIWSVVLLKKSTKLSIWNRLGVFLLFATFGSALTNAIANQCTIIEIYKYNLEWINILAYLGCGVSCFIIAFVRKGKR